MYVYQCWCWEDWCVYYSEHRSGKDEVWRSGRPLPDRQDSPNSETGYGADRGISVMQGRSSQGRSHKQHIKEYNTSFWFSPNNNISWLYLYLQIQKATQHCGFISICADTIHVSMAPPARAIQTCWSTSRSAQSYTELSAVPQCTADNAQRRCLLVYLLNGSVRAGRDNRRVYRILP